MRDSKNPQRTDLIYDWNVAGTGYPHRATPVGPPGLYHDTKAGAAAALDRGLARRPCATRHAPADRSVAKFPLGNDERDRHIRRSGAVRPLLARKGVSCHLAI
jgi:hypothetical protein